MSVHAEISAIDEQYGGWENSMFAFRDALRLDPLGVEDAKDAWCAWLRDRGDETTWLPRVSISDSGVGTLTVVDGPHKDVLAAPRVYGTIDDPELGRPVTIPVDGARYWTVPDATVTGGWDVITTPCGACWPALNADTESVLVSNALDSRLLGWTRSFMVVREPSSGMRRRVTSVIRRRRPRLDAAIMLVGEHSFQYGHWMIDYVGRALAARGIDESIPVLVDAAVPANPLWWLDRVLPRRRVIPLAPGEAIDVATLIVPLQRTFCPTGWIDPLEVDAFVWPWDSVAIAALNHAAKSDRAGAARTRRLFLSRRPGTNRAFVNQDDLEELSIRAGFERVYLEDLSMPRVQTLLEETRQVIAPLGSQVMNAVAASPGLQVLVLAGPAVGLRRAGPAHFGRICGHEVALVGGRAVGPPPRTPYDRMQSPYEVDPELFEAARHHFFSSPGMVAGGAAQ